jgi:hypothetical protein
VEILAKYGNDDQPVSNQRSGGLGLPTFWFVATPNKTKSLSLRDLSFPQMDKPDKLSICE